MIKLFYNISDSNQSCGDHHCNVIAESRFPSLNSSILSNLKELEKLVQELEECVEALKKAVNLHLYLSCDSSIHSKDCSSLRNAQRQIMGLSDVSSNYLQFHRSYNRTQNICSFKELQEFKEKYLIRNKNLIRKSVTKRFTNKLETLLFNYEDFRKTFNASVTTDNASEVMRPTSFCEILQEAQENLDNAVLAVKQYEIVAWDITSVMDIEKKVIITRAKELCRQTNVFDKMTEGAITKLNSLSIDEEDQAYCSSESDHE